MASYLMPGRVATSTTSGNSYLMPGIVYISTLVSEVTGVRWGVTHQGTIPQVMNLVLTPYHYRRF